MYKRNLEFELRNLKMGDDNVFNSSSSPPPPKLNHQISKNSQHVNTNNTIKENRKSIKRSHSLPATMDIYDYDEIKQKLFNSLEISKTTNLEKKNLEKVLKNSYLLSRPLTEYEENEIKTISRYDSNFSKIYYLGETFKTNYDLGIKDLDDYYIFIANDQILYRYKTISKIGKGSYGRVLKCFDNKNKFNCALKISRNNPNYKQSFKHEVEILKILNYNLDYYTRISQTKSDLISMLYKTFIWRGHGIISLKLYDNNLYSANINEYSEFALKIIMIDILEALNYCCFRGIIHGDLKPENIFYINNTSYHVVIGDFGLAVNTNNNTKKLSHNIQTIWYRAPEIILRLPYNYSIDIWSVGVIILELIANKPIFKTQKEYLVYFQMSYFLEKPNYYGRRLNSKENINLITDLRKNTTEYDILYFKTRINNINKSFSNSDHSTIINFIKENILLWDPTKRYTASKALKYLLEDLNIASYA
jgi:hypothetical protein